VFPNFLRNGRAHFAQYVSERLELAKKKTKLNMKKSNVPFAAILLVFAWLPLSPEIKAVVPAPDGGYPNGNTAEGDSALFSLTSGTENTAIGAGALYSNTTGIRNTATGFQTLNVNNGGSFNTANGYRALHFNTGAANTATGASALQDNINASNNTATGFAALLLNMSGSNNTATGAGALQDNTASNNTATGFAALLANSTGTQNTATGALALNLNNGTNNTADGFQALLNNSGNNNIAIGSNAGRNLTTGSNNIDIGAFGTAGESNTIRIGKGGLQTNAYMQGIRGRTVASGVTVIVGTDGHLGTVVCSARFKDEIKPMDKVSEAILALKPVTFRYKKSLDPEGVPQFGLVAEEVAKVNSDLVARDENGEIYTVRYDAVNAMLLNEFLKEHRTVQEQKATIMQLKKDFAEQRIQIEALTTGLQKVSDQLETRRETTKVVINNP
jgi:Chaperone of endosialidase